MQYVSVIPVAIGTIIHSITLLSPLSFNKSRTSSFVNLFRTLEPIAFG